MKCREEYQCSKDVQDDEGPIPFDVDVEVDGEVDATDATDATDAMLQPPQEEFSVTCDPSSPRFCSDDIIQLYFSHIGSRPLLTRDEEERYATMMKQGDFEARQKMIEHNLRLVVSIAKRFVNRGMPLLDLIEEGNIGLMHALDKFEPERGFRFSTYACWWIRAAVEAALFDHSRTVRLPVHVVKEFNQILKAKSSIEIGNADGKCAQSRDIASLTGLDHMRVEKTLSLMSDSVSIDFAYGSDGHLPSGGFLLSEEEEQPERQFEQRETNRVVRRLVERLPDKERFVIKLRFGLDDDETTETFDAIARQMGVTPERVRQIQAKGIRELRRALARYGLVEN